jgi:2'-5' RNA ligase
VPRVRLGVVLPVPEPVAAEIDGLRRALGDGALGRIPAHLTLVPPVNVAVERLEEVRAVLDAAAASRAPVPCQLGPPTSFWPVTPVVYLSVDERAGAAIHAARRAVFHPPLSRRLTYEFVPHVTLADEVDPDRIGPALAALADYRRSVVFDRIAVLQEGEGHRWTPIYEAVLTGAWVVGRGGVELTMSVTAAGEASARMRAGLPPGLVVTARRQGVVVGVAECRLDPAEPAVARLVELQVESSERGLGIGSQLLAALMSRAAADLGATRLTVSPAPPAGAGFLLRRGFATAPAAERMGLARDL